MDIRETLEHLGFSNKEILVYLAILELGESILSQVSIKAGLPRSTVLHVLESLKSKGVVEIAKKTTGHLFTPKPPRALLTILRSQELKIHDQLAAVEKVMPELNRIYSSSPFFPKVRIFQGRKEIRDIYEEVLESPIEETLTIGDPSAILNAVGEDYFNKWIIRRVKKGIRNLGIRSKELEDTNTPFSAKEGFLRKARLAPKEFESPVHVMIFGFNVAIITTSRENIGIVITSKDFAIMVKSCFKELWKHSKPI